MGYDDYRCVDCDSRYCPENHCNREPGAVYVVGHGWQPEDRARLLEDAGAHVQWEGQQPYPTTTTLHWDGWSNGPDNVWKRCRACGAWVHVSVSPVCVSCGAERPADDLAGL